MAPSFRGFGKRCGPLPRRDRTYCDDCLPTHYQRKQYEKAFRDSGLAAIEKQRASGADPTHGEEAAARRAKANVACKRQAREWDESHGKLVDLSAFRRDRPSVRLPRSAAATTSRRRRRSKRPLARLEALKSYPDPSLIRNVHLL